MFFDILIPYSRCSRIDETNLDGFPTRAFFTVFEALGTVFLVFVALETGLKIDRFLVM